MGGGGLPTHRDQKGIASFLPGLPQALCLPTTSRFLPLARPSWPSSSPGSSSLEQQKSVLFTWLRSLEPVLQGFHRTVRRLHLGEKVGNIHVKIPAMPKLKQNKIATTNPKHYRNALAWPAIRNTNHFPKVSTQAAKHHSTCSSHQGEDEWELAVLMALWSSCRCCTANENRHKLQFWNTLVPKNWEAIQLTVGSREQEGHQSVCTVNVDKVQRMIRVMGGETTK